MPHQSPAMGVATIVIGILSYRRYTRTKNADIELSTESDADAAESRTPSFAPLLARVNDLCNGNELPVRKYRTADTDVLEAP
jgi:hypothetical protein